jgi:hypothetical protein
MSWQTAFSVPRRPELEFQCHLAQSPTECAVHACSHSGIEGRGEGREGKGRGGEGRGREEMEWLVVL